MGIRFIVFGLCALIFGFGCKSSRYSESDEYKQEMRRLEATTPKPRQLSEAEVDSIEQIRIESLAEVDSLEQIRLEALLKESETGNGDAVLRGLRQLADATSNADRRRKAQQEIQRLEDEKAIGVRLEVLRTGWGLDGRRIRPQFELRVENVSGYDISHTIYINASFLDIDRKEVVGEGSSTSPFRELRSGYSFNEVIVCRASAEGHLDQELPSIEADIEVQIGSRTKKLTIPIKKELAAYKWEG